MKLFDMKLYDKMRQQKLLSTTLLLVTLSVGILIGTLVNTGVKAARDQQAAPDATPLVIPHAQEVGNEFTKLAKKLGRERGQYHGGLHAEELAADAPAPQSASRTRTRKATTTAWICSGASSGIAATGAARRLPPQAYRREQSGTGFIVDKNGYIITNHHVVSDTNGDSVDHIYVKLHGDTTEYRAKLIGSDRESDIAVIKIEPQAHADAGDDRQLGRRAGGRLGGGDRLSVRPGSDRDGGHYQRHRP